MKSKIMLKKLGFKRDIDGTWLNKDSETRITLEDGYLLISGYWADETTWINAEEFKAIVEYCLDEKFIDGYEEKKKWIPFKLRSCDEDEKKEYGTDQIWDVPLPDNGEQILVSDGKEDSAIRIFAKAFLGMKSDQVCVLEGELSLDNIKIYSKHEHSCITGKMSRSIPVGIFESKRKVREWSSARDAAKDLYISRQTVCNYCNGRIKKPMYDLRWLG